MLETFVDKIMVSRICGGALMTGISERVARVNSGNTKAAHEALV